MCYCTTSISAPWCNQCGPRNHVGHGAAPIGGNVWYYTNKYSHAVDSETAKFLVVQAAVAFGEAKAAVELAEKNLENARQALLKMTTKPTA